MLKQLLSRWSLPGWLFAAGSGLGYGSTAEFVLRWLRKLMDFLNHNPAWGLLIGFVWLTAVGLWPKYARYIRVVIPKPLHERIKDLETGHSTASERLAVLDPLQESLAKQDQRLQALERIQINAVQRSPQRIKDVLDATELLREVDTAIEWFLNMMTAYGTTDRVVAHPFSGWRPKYPRPESLPDNIRDGETLAHSLELHLQHANIFFLIRHLPLPDFSTGHLFVLIGTWAIANNETSGDELLKLLRTHREEIGKIQNGYAAAFTVGK